MRRRNPLVRAALLGLLLGAAGPLHADAPLAPPADFTHEHEAATVIGSVVDGSTTILPLGTDVDAMWRIPVWARWYQLAPDGLSIIVLNNGGNLLGTRDPEQIVATVWYVKAGAVLQQDFTLIETMNPADMPTTTGHYLWLTTYRSAESGWELELSDGKTVTISYR